MIAWTMSTPSRCWRSWLERSPVTLARPTASKEGRTKSHSRSQLMEAHQPEAQARNADSQCVSVGASSLKR